MRYISLKHFVTVFDSFSVEEGSNGKRFVCSAKIKVPTVEGTLCMKGDERSKKKEAESSAAYHMIRALRCNNYL